MGTEILYLDGSRNRAVEKAIKKYGKVYYAKDINEAVELIADRKFDYYFLDADIPYVRELLVHLEHDPYFMPPRAFVLLTDNEVEDCAAWKVDTFITRRRIREDLPFVFSHLVGEPPDNTGVLRLITEDNDRDAVLEENGLASTDSCCVEEFERHDLTEDPECSAVGDGGPPEMPGGREPYRGHAGDNQGEVINRPVKGLRVMRSPIRLVAGGIFTIALLVLLYALVPIGSGNVKKDSTKKTGVKAAASETGKKEDADDGRPADFVYGNELVNPEEAVNVSQTPAANRVEEESAASTTSDTQSTESNDNQSNTYSGPPPAAPVNNPPSVSISGPTQVSRGQTATYTASAGDPDGDAISYSWGSSSKNMSWSAPGLFTVSVTVTDSRGASGSASISVRVI